MFFWLPIATVFSLLGAMTYDIERTKSDAEALKKRLSQTKGQTLLVLEEVLETAEGVLDSSRSNEVALIQRLRSTFDAKTRDELKKELEYERGLQGELSLKTEDLKRQMEQIRKSL
jgi:hypothetical protein